MPLEFQRNKTETMTTVEAADKRQAGRREWQESQRDTGKEEGKMSESETCLQKIEVTWWRQWQM